MIDISPSPRSARGSNSPLMPSYPPGGTMDVTAVRPGSILYLRVMTKGALLSMGDIHAIMAEGEARSSRSRPRESRW